MAIAPPRELWHVLAQLSVLSEARCEKNAFLRDGTVGAKTDIKSPMTSTDFSVSLRSWGPRDPMMYKHNLSATHIGYL